MTARLLAASACVALAALVAGAVGAIVAASLAAAWLGSDLLAEYAAAPEPAVDLPHPAAKPMETLRQLDRISGQLAIGMSDGRYFDRAVRPRLSRIATGIAAARGGGGQPDGDLLTATARPGRAPTLSELSALVDRMEQL